MTRGLREVYAEFDSETIVVYQAYTATIATPAATSNKFSTGFKRDRMTWIKPSFLWMMYRSGWSSKQGQEHVLAIRITREGFEWALRHSAWSHFDPSIHTDNETWRASLIEPVRIQWDPERDIRLQPLSHRSLQVGLSGEASRRFCDQWIVSITDITETAHEVGRLVASGKYTEASELTPVERLYPVPTDIVSHLAMA